MSRIYENNNKSIQNLNNQSKRLRFHPYYYMGRIGSYYPSMDKKRIQIKIIKIIKYETKVELILQEKKKLGNKFVLRIIWDTLEFDYYTIKNGNWQIRFSKI